MELLRLVGWSIAGVVTIGTLSLRMAMGTIAAPASVVYLMAALVTFSAWGAAALTVVDWLKSSRHDVSRLLLSSIAASVCPLLAISPLLSGAGLDAWVALLGMSLLGLALTGGLAITEGELVDVEVANTAASITTTPVLDRSSPQELPGALDDSSIAATIFTDHQIEQQLVRRAGDGTSSIEGLVRVRFAAGVRQESVQLAFTPALPGIPEVECEVLAADNQSSLESYEVQIAATFAYGLRLDVKRSGQRDEAVEIILGINAITEVGANATRAAA